MRASPWLRRRLVLMVATLVAATPLLATPVQAADGRPAPTLAVSSKKTQDDLIQHITVEWHGAAKNKVQSKNAVIPGIGDLAMICRGNSTMIRLYSDKRQRETQMWLQKYEDKQQRPVVAVKTPRIYRYQHALDNGKGGTGYYTSEGLNTVTPIENYSKGTINGIISQRPGRNVSGGAFATLPVTSFELNWYWNGFEQPAQYRYCKIDAVFTTQLAPAQMATNSRMGITWRGNADAAGRDTQTTALTAADQTPIGDLALQCRAEYDPAGTAQTLTIGTDVYVERVFGEGRVEEHVFGQAFAAGEPIALPRNGTLRIRLADTDRWLLLSSYYITNNPDPRLNLCEVSAAIYSR